MIDQFKEFQMDVKQFCTYHYDENIEGHWVDQSTDEYVEQRYNCLEAAGIKKGYKFCMAFKNNGDNEAYAKKMKECCIEQNV